jgi:hypothetical protein
MISCTTGVLHPSVVVRKLGVVSHKENNWWFLQRMDIAGIIQSTVDKLETTCRGSSYTIIISFKKTELVKVVSVSSSPPS